MSSKKRTPKFLQALANYSALGGALVGAFNQAQAAIQYTTLSGSQVPTGGNSVVNLPGGALTFQANSGSVLIYPSGGISFLGPASWYPGRLDANHSVSAGGTWQTFHPQWLALSFSTAPGLFDGYSGKFIGIRFNSGGQKYGWIRLDVAASGDAFTLIDWAYEDNGASILTGQTTGLPIELAAFEARQLEASVELSWTTLREENFHGFSLERAEAGGQFAEISWVPGQNQPADQPKAYRYVDAGIFENKRYYYRLKSVDLDGSYDYSPVVESGFNELGFSVAEPYPNPVAEGRFQLDIQAQDPQTARLMLFSGTGQAVKEQPVELRAGLNTVEVAIPELAAGTYFLKIAGRFYSEYRQLVVE